MTHQGLLIAGRRIMLAVFDARLMPSTPLPTQVASCQKASYNETNRISLKHFIAALRDSHMEAQ